MIKQKFLFTALIFSLLFPFQNAFADNASSTLQSSSSKTSPTLASTTPGSILGLQAPPVPPIIAEMDQAKTLLASVNLNHALAPVYKKNKKGKTVLTAYNLTAKDIALAILDPATNNVVVTVGMQTGKTMVFKDPAVDVQLASFNGVNSKFQINTPANGTVIALKYLISNPDSGSKAKIEKGLSSAIYVPYSDALSSPDVIKYGADYINGVITKAAAQLQYLPSRSVPGKTMTDAIPPALIKSLIYAEHTDTTAILSGSDIQGTMDKLNILFATNRENTFNYSVSTAGARGIAQFIPSTYTSLVQRHPEAGLIPDFVAGMSDHVNSVKAMYVLIDDYAGAVRVKAANSFAEGHVFEYGAASYNGGTARVANAVNTFGTEWDTDHSGQINSLQSEVNSLTGQVKTLKSKIKSVKDAKTKASLQSQLAAAQSQLSTDSTQLTSYKSASLRNETVNYLAKIYKVIQYFNA